MVGHLRPLVDVPVFDTDVLFRPAWDDWANDWLLVAHSLAQSGYPTVLCGYGLRRSGIGALPANALLGPVHQLHLRLAEDELRARLVRRGVASDRIERKVHQAVGLGAESDQAIDATAITSRQLAAAVAGWIATTLPTNLSDRFE
jgi:hypothetical protein